LLEALHRNAEVRGGKAALGRKVGGRWESIFYAEFYERVRRFASGLAQMGVGEGARVALLSGNRPKWPISDYAIQSLRAATVPIYPTLEPDQVGHILADSGARVAVIEDVVQLEKVQKARDAGQTPELERVVVMDDSYSGEAGGGAERFADVEAAGAESPMEGWEEGWRALKPQSVATIIYTSGTTGAPKGAVLTHGNFLSNVEGVLQALPFREDDVMLSFLPLSHVFERCGQYLTHSVGATTYYAESTDKVAENLREVRPTTMFSVPRLYEKMYDRIRQRVAEGPAARRRLFEAAISAGRRRYALEKAGRPVPRGLEARLALYDRLVFKKVREATGGRLRFFVAGGAKLSPEIGEFFYAAGLTIIEGYGLTETSPVIACNRMPVPRFGTVGPPLHNVEVKISESGEVLTRGPHVMQGYFENEEATREAFTEDGFFKTGDVGELDEAGCLRITDRIKNIMVLSTGKNVAPQPVETALVEAPSIVQAVLVGDGRRYVSALVVPDYDAVRKALGTEAANEELCEDASCREMVWREIAAHTAGFADFERPKRFALLPRELSVEAGELTPTLKVKLRVVKERYRDEIEGLYA